MHVPPTAPGDVLDRNVPKTLGLLWALILHFQIGCAPLSPQPWTMAPLFKRKQQSKRCMLTWVNAVLPGRNITNFTTDWNDGVNLVALVNYCKPGLIESDSYAKHPFERVAKAMQLAHTELEVCQVMSPEDLHMEQPEELCVMTYLSYFCRPGSPGERVLLAWVQREIPDANITNLTTNWVNGVSLGALVDALTQHGFPQYKKMNPTSRVDNCQESMRQAQSLLKIPATISAEDFSNTDLDYLTRLSYLVQFYAAKRGEPVALRADVNKVQVSPVNTGEEGGVRVVWVDLDCSKAGHADVQATASTAAGKNLKETVSELQQDQYRVKLACEEGVDVYTLSIRYGGEEVNGSPFCVNLAPADAAKVQHKGSDIPTEEQQKVVLGFETKEAGYGKMTAVATGECAGAVPVELVPKPNGGIEVVFTPPIPDVYSVDVKWGKFVALAKGQSCGAVPIDLFQGAEKDFKLAFEPPTPDIYTVDVTWGGKPVPGSPFVINLLPPAKPEKVEVGDPIYSGAGEGVDFLVDITHAGSGKLTASCKGEKVGDVPTSIVAISKRAFQVMFTPPEVDIYYLSIFFEGVPVQGSPFRINLLQKHRSVEVPQPKYNKEIGTSMVIRVKRTGGEKKAKVTAVAYGDATGPCGTHVKKNAEGNYEVTLDPKRPDIYTLDIRLNNNPIPNSPFIVNYLPRIIPDHTKCRLIDINLKEFLNRLLDIDSNVHFTVDTREGGQSTLEASVDAPDGKTYDVELKAREDEPQVFDISYTTKMAGTHYLKVLWDGKPIPESPLAIRVVDFGKVQNFTHGKKATVEVDVPSDVREKDIKVRIFHVITGTLSKISGRLLKGKYRVSFDPKMSGLYSIHILIKDKEIRTSPVVIRYGDPPRPELCVVQDLPHHTFMDADVTFTVDCSKSGSGELYVKTIQRQLLKRDKSRVSWKEISENVYTVTFTPVTIGDHTILITWAGKPIKGSPHHVTVVEKPPEVKRPTSELYTMDLMSTSPQRERVDPIPEVVNSTIGHALLLKVTIPSKEIGLLTSLGRGLKSIFKDEITATAVGEKTGQAEIRVKNNYDDTYDVVFTPEQPDRYAIAVRYEEEDMEVAQITAVFGRAPTDPTKVEVVGMSEWELPVQCFIHQEFKFEMSTKEAGPGTLRVRVEAPGMEGEPLLTINKEERHRYSIRYIPQTIGTHLLHLLWDGTTIPNSPLTIEVKEPPTVQPGQPGIFEISAGKWKLSDIKATGVHLDTGTEYKVKKTQKKGKYMFTLQPSEPGNYEISLRVNGIEIARPFRFKFDRPCLPDKVVVFGLRGDGDVKETIKFKVDVSDAGNGSLKVSATGPAKPSLNITDNKDGTYSISFRATIAGSYYLTVTWAGEEIPNSPFKIDITDPVSRRKDEDEEDGGWGWGWGWKSKSSSTTYSIDTRNVLEELGDDLDSFVTGFLGYFGRRSGSSDGGTVTTETTTHTSTNVVGKKEVRDEKQSSQTVFKIGRMTRWEIDMTDLDGDLEVTATGAKTGSVDVQLTQVREGVFEVTFNPTKPDRYTISIMVNGVHLPNSPVIVTYELPETNAKNVKVVGLKKIPSLITVGQKVRVIVDCRDGGIGEFKVDAKVPSSKEKTHTLDIEPFNDDPAMFDVTYTPLVVGVHSLQLLWAKMAIPGSPVDINVCNPQLVTYDSLSSGTIKIGKPMKIEYDISLAGCGELTATCTGANTGDVPVSISKGKSKGRYEVSFQPQAEDLYVLVVMLGQYQVSGSPFNINLSHIQVDKINVTGPVRPDGPQGPVELTVDARDLPRGKLVSICKYDKTKTVSVTVKETAPNVYLLHFQPPKPAQYVWSVTYNGQDIPHSPYFIDTLAHPERTSVVVPQHASIGQYVYYEVDVSGAGMGTLTATCSSTKSKKVPVEITEVRQGVFGISFLPFAFATYTLYVQWSGREIPNSPFIFTLSPPPRKETIKPIDFPLPLPPVEDTSAIEISCTGEVYGTIPTKLVAVSATKYHVSFKPQGPDLYTLSVMFNGRHVRGSPYPIDLRVTDESSSDEEDEDLVVPSGGGRSKSPTPTPSQEFNNFIGSALVVRVRPRTAAQRNGKVVATATGKKTGNAKINVEKFSEDYFEVTFSPTEPDTYTVSITLNGEPIPRSPFIVHYHKQPARPSKVRIIGLQDLPSFLEVDKEVSLLIDTTNGGTGVFRAEVKGPDDSKSKPKLEVKPRDEEPGMYDLMFRPLIAGAYTLSLYWADKHITNSPLTLRVIDLSVAKRIEWGRDATTGDIVIACKPTDITAYAVRENSTNELKVKVKQIKKDRYRFSFSSKDSGLYYLHILAYKEELPISPIPLYILPAPQPKKCVVKGGASVGYVTEEINLTVDCTEGGQVSTLVARVVGPKGLEKLLDAVNNKDGTYTVTYVPSAAGVYYFHITWGGTAISKSPFRVEVRERKKNELPVAEVAVVDRTEQTQAIPDSGKDDVALTTDHDFSFTIRVTEEQSKSIVARLTDESGKSFKFKMIRIKGDLFKFVFTPPSPGRFNIDFNLGDLKLDLPQLPKWLTYTEPRAEVTKVKVLKHTIPGLLQINRKIFFQVDTRLAGNGSLEFKLEGPSTAEADLRVVPTPDKPHFYDVSFTPVAAGVYTLELLWGGSILPGFPLTFDVVSTEIQHGESSSHEINIDSSARNITCYAIHVETGERLKVKLTQVSRGRYRLSFRPKRSGSYNLHIFVGKEEIAGSPFRVSYSKPSQPWNVVVSSLERTARVNSAVKFTIDVRSAGDGDLNIKLVGPQSDVPKINLREKKSGLYEAEFTPQVGGDYHIEITWSGEQVPSSPFLVNVRERTTSTAGVSDYNWLLDYFDQKKERAFEEETHQEYAAPPQPTIHSEDLHIFGKGLAFRPVSFRISHGGFPDSLDIHSKGPKGLLIRVIKGDGANTYEIEPRAPGTYELTILMNGEVISGGPYMLLFQSPRTVTGFNLQAQSFQVGKSYQFTIDTRDIASGVMEIYCEPQDAAELRIQVAPGTSVYECSLTPKLVGDCKIGVRYNGFEIQGSPFLVHFRDAAPSSLNFHIRAEGIETGDVTAMLESMATQQVVPISLNQLFGGECNLEFLPTEGDEYTLTITCNLKVKKERVAGSPFSLMYVASERNASMCQIEGNGLYSAVLGEWSKFVVNCEEAGPGELTAKIVGEGAEVKVVALSEYKYEVQYFISAAGRYQLFVQWGGEDILGSPFEISILPATTTSTSMQIHVADIPQEVKATSPIQFTMEWQGGWDEGGLVVIADTSAGGKVNGELQAMGGDNYRVTIPTTEAGDYSINIYYRGSPLLQQPMTVSVSP